MLVQIRHSARPRFRLLGAGLLVLLGCSAVTACDWTAFIPSEQSATPKDTKEYSQFGVTAQLPGTTWNISLPSDLDPRGLDEGYLAASPDKSLVYFITRRSMSVSDVYVNVFLETFVGSYSSTEYKDTPPVASSSAIFHGHRAIRLEGVRGSHQLPELTEDYRFVQYFFVVGSEVYIVGTGVKLSKWDDSTRALAQSILDTVKVP